MVSQNVWRMKRPELEQLNTNAAVKKSQQFTLRFV